MRLAPLAILVLAAALLAGCGGSSDGTGTTGADSGATASTTGSTAPSPTAPAGAGAKTCETEAVDAEDLRATGIGCAEARRVMFTWQRRRGGCAPQGASAHAGCTVDSYRCVATVAGRGIGVGCGRPGHSLAFTVRR